MTQPKTKADKEAGLLSETAKTYMNDLFLLKEFGYKENVVTEEMLKGNICEQDSMELWQKYLKCGLLLKNTKTLQNDYLIGTPDIINGDFIDDLKTSWSLKTFFNAEASKDNEWQIKAYCELTGKTKGRVVYCLVPTPIELIEEQKKRFYFRYGCDEEGREYKQIAEQIEHNNNLIEKIPIEKRVKIFQFDYTKEDKLLIETQCYKALNYYKTLSL